jgi:predicted DNA-binding mobile mystery protein A
MSHALGMSSYQLARRMGFSPTRVREFERAEVDGSIRLSSLRCAAEALNCQLTYAFVPNEALDDMVQRQAYFKACAQLCKWGPDHPRAGDPDLVAEERIDELEDEALHFVDHRDLWR